MDKEEVEMAKKNQKFKDEISNIFISKEFNRLDLINKIIDPNI